MGAVIGFMILGLFVGFMFYLWGIGSEDKKKGTRIEINEHMLAYWLYKIYCGETFPNATQDRYENLYYRQLFSALTPYLKREPSKYDKNNICIPRGEYEGYSLNDKGMNLIKKHYGREE